MPDYVWKPIEPLTESERKIDLGGMRPLYEGWRESKDRLELSSASQLSKFNQRLVRRLSVETGVLERLYDLDHGTTEALIAHGFAEELIKHGSTNIEPARLIDILRDQEAAIQLVMDCVAKKRAITKGLMHELHAILTKHEETTEAVDQFGNHLYIPLLRGQFKQLPNNPKRPAGGLHEYCPPLHVDSEIDNLLTWLPQYLKEDPIIVSAWLHHRFTQIHPYQDGNGRLARTLTTMILLGADLLPIVVVGIRKAEYIRSLELADGSDLTELAKLFATLERGAILQALSIEPDVQIAEPKSLTSAVIDSLADKLEKRRVQEVQELGGVNSLARDLREIAANVLRESFRALDTVVQELGGLSSAVNEEGSDKDTGHLHKGDVIRAAQEADKFANFAENHYLVQGSLEVHQHRLIFVVSFHHVGRDLTGIMEATAFAKLESFQDSENCPCSLDPFVFTYKTKFIEINDSFAKWLDAALAVALKSYVDRL